jgi:hypothetical protein
LPQNAKATAPTPALGSSRSGEFAKSSSDTETPEERRGRVLSKLIEAARETYTIIRFRHIAGAIQQLGSEDIAAALEAAKRLKGESGSYVSPQVIARWVDFDPPAAAAYALAIKTGQRKKPLTPGSPARAHSPPKCAKRLRSIARYFFASSSFAWTAAKSSS